ncbi:hypothetical protein LTR57_013247 [Friedmanniomyces endolithicus]|nr:hypothetical protein LTR57_013247 [Friedmanniomyces endolithicus]
MSPNGPSDGGLVVLAGSHKHHKQHFDQIGGFRPEQDQGAEENGYDYTAQDVAFYHAQGCKEVKICAKAGDLILWDSRTIHWNASPVGEQIRFISYVCYCPRTMASEEELARKLEVSGEEGVDALAEHERDTCGRHKARCATMPAERVCRSGESLEAFH